MKEQVAEKKVQVEELQLLLGKREEEVAQALGAPLITWHVKSTTKAAQGLYEYDAVSRLRDSQLCGLA